MEEVPQEDKWFYEEDGEKKGPLTEKEIGGLVHTSALSGKTRVWKQGFVDWKSVEDTDLARFIDKSVPPVVKVKNLWVWLIALLPLYSGLMWALMVGIYVGIAGYRATESGVGYVALVYLVLLFAFYVWLVNSDEKAIKKAGYSGKISSWAWLIVPVYLYKRSKFLNQNFMFLFIWIGSFVASILFL